MAFKIQVNGDEVFKTDKNVREVSLSTANGAIGTVSGDVDTLVVNVTEEDGLNAPIDELYRNQRNERRKEVAERQKELNVTANDDDKSTVKKTTASSGSKK